MSFDHDIVQRARDLAPIIRETADEAEAQRHLPARAAQAMAEAGLHRVAAPATVGGLECTPETQVRVIEAISEAGGAAGWTHMIGIEALGVVGAALSSESAAEVVGDPNVIVCGALNPLGRAVPVQGGYRISGQWPFASGCHNADWFHGQCIVYDGDERRLEDDGRVFLREMLVPRDEFRIVDTWKVSGLRGSGSHDVAVDDVFVPDHHVTAITNQGLVADGPLYRMPLLTRLAYNKVGVATGIARGAISQFIDFASDKTPRGATNLLRERPQAQIALADAEALLESGRAYLFQTLAQVWQACLAGEEITREQRAHLQLAATHATSSAVKAVELVHEAAGSSANYTESPLNRSFRDVHVVPQHIMVSPQWMNVTGRVLLGLESGSPLL